MASDDLPALRAGIALLRQNQPHSAEPLLEAAANESGGALAWHSLGVARHLLGKVAAAADAFRTAIGCGDATADAYSALAVVLGQSDAWSEAERVLLKGLERFPADAGLHFNVAVACEHRGADTEALAHYEMALQARPEYRDALLNRGALHLRHGRRKPALKDFDAILAQHPQAVDALLNRARVLMQLHRDDEALAAVQAALQISPGRKEARQLLAVALASLGYLDAAARTMRVIDPGWDATSVYVERALSRQDVCIWDDRDRAVSTMRDLLGSGRASGIDEFGPYVRMLAMPFSPNELKTAANAVAARVQALRVDRRLNQRRSSTARIRVGLVCEGVGRHPQTYLLRRLASELDRTCFEVHLYALNRDDGTTLRRDFAAGADAFADLSALDSVSIVDLLRRDELDVAFDGAGYFQPARPEIFKARVAPIQVAYLATPGPHGQGLVDYRLSDAWTTPPDTQAAWTEKLVLLPPPHWIYDNRIERGSAGSRADHGLPSDGFVFCCMTQPWKLEPESFSIWMRLLRSVEGSVLWLLDSGEANARLRVEASSRGVPPERLIFAPRIELEAHLGRLAHADLVLDTFYFNAQTTALDALWAGVPLVSRSGSTMASRLAATFLRSAGLDELATSSSGAYEAAALRLACEPGALSRLRGRLAAAHQAGPLFDTVARVQAVQRAIVAMVERHRRGLSPETLVID